MRKSPNSSSRNQYFPRCIFRPRHLLELGYKTSKRLFALFTSFFCPVTHVVLHGLGNTRPVRALVFAVLFRDKCLQLRSRYIVEMQSRLQDFLCETVIHIDQIRDCMQLVRVLDS